MFKRNIFIALILFILLKAIEYILSYIFDYLNIKKAVNQFFKIGTYDVINITFYDINFNITILEFFILIFIVLYFLIYNIVIKKLLYKYLLKKNNYLINLDLKEQFNKINTYKGTIQVSCFDYMLSIKIIELYTHHKYKYTTLIILDDFVDSKIDKLIDFIIKKLHLPIKTKFELLANQILSKIVDKDIYISDIEEFKKLINSYNLSMQGIIFLLNDKTQIKNSNINKLIDILLKYNDSIKPNVFLLVQNDIYNQNMNNIIYLQGLTFKQSTHHFFEIIKQKIKNNSIKDRHNNVIIKDEVIIYQDKEYKFKNILEKLDNYNNFTTQKFMQDPNCTIDEYELIFAYLYKVYIMHYGYSKIYMPFINQCIKNKEIDLTKSLYVKNSKTQKVPAGVFYYSDKFSLPNNNNYIYNILIKLDFFKIIDNKIVLNEDYLMFNNYRIKFTKEGINKINALYNDFLNNIKIKNNQEVEVLNIKDEYFSSLKLGEENLIYKKLQNNIYLLNSIYLYFNVEKVYEFNNTSQYFKHYNISNNYNTNNYYTNAFSYGGTLGNDISISTIYLKTISLLENYNNEYLIELMSILGVIFKVKKNEYYLNDIENIQKVFLDNINTILKNDILHYRINKNKFNNLLNSSLIYPIGKDLYMPLDVLQVDNCSKLRYLLYLNKNDNMRKLYKYIENYIHDKDIKYKIGFNQLKFLAQMFSTNQFLKKKTILKLFENRKFYQYSYSMPYSYFMYQSAWKAYNFNKEIEIYKLFYVKEIFNEKHLYDMYKSDCINNSHVNLYLSYLLTVERLLCNKKKYNKLIQLFKIENNFSYGVSDELMIGFNFIEDKEIINNLYNLSSYKSYFKYIIIINRLIEKNRIKNVEKVINKLENLPTSYLDSFNLKEDYIKFVRENFIYKNNNNDKSWFSSTYLMKFIGNKK